MLAEVCISDLALLERVQLELSPGLNVVSGETGEGKSLLLRAITLLMGARARKGLVRAGCKEAVIEGRFRVDDRSRERLRACCDLVEVGADEICLRRVISAGGASRAYVNGSFVTAGVLSRVGAELVDIHGQSEHLSLRRGREQGRALDRFGGLVDKAGAYAETFRELSVVLSRLESAAVDEAARADRRDLLRFQLSEFDDLEPQPGEESRLRAEMEILASGVELREALRAAVLGLTEEEGSVGGTCARIGRSLADLAPDDPRLSAIRERVESLRLEAEDLGQECMTLEAGLETDPGRKDEVAARLDRLRALAYRHQVHGDGLAAFRDGLQEELEALDSPGSLAAELETERSRLETRLRSLGKELKSLRKRAGSRLEKEIAGGLAELRMKEARFQVTQVTQATGAGSSKDLLASGEEGPGAGRFLVAANPGEALQPMEQVASGGETARILLALRGALAGHHRIPLLIFDEIDSGIGSRIGLSFGRRIATIASHHQVLVVTHLPQVAAWAETHLRVVKTVSRGRTRTDVRILKRKDRIRELADMLGGDIAVDAARAQAQAMLEEAGT